MTRKKLYIVKLSQKERKHLQSIVSSGISPARVVTRARILLKADQDPGRPAWIDRKIADAFDIALATIKRIRQKYYDSGLMVAISTKKPVYSKPKRKLTGEQEAKVIAIVLSPPPHGRVKWTVRLLTKRVVELEIVEEISRETIRKFLKKRV